MRARWILIKGVDACAVRALQLLLQFCVYVMFETVFLVFGLEIILDHVEVILTYFILTSG